MDHNANLAGTTAEQERYDDALFKVKRCLDIIQFRPDGEKYGNQSAARAIPNHCLKNVFGIENSFVDAGKDSKSRRGFRQGTITKMRAACNMKTKDDKGDRTDLRTHAMKYLDEYLEHETHGESISLATAVQFTTLKLSLHYLFDEADAAFDTKDTFENIVFIGQQINELWIASKNSADAQPRWEEQRELQAALRRVTTATSNSENVKITPKDNPLNYLLPAYETMWRVVMRCFIEVRLRSATDSSAWQDILANYLEDLGDSKCMEKSPNTFKKPSATGLLPIDIAKEALRLYPPSRRVHREFDGDLLHADIEACHRLKPLSGNDPLTFRPERWQDICAELRDKAYGGDEDRNIAKKLKHEELRRGFMPFATLCPADTGETKAFAMKMILMLVAILCGKLGDDWKLADRGSLPELGVALESSRDAYGDLRLEKV